MNQTRSCDDYLGDTILLHEHTSTHINDTQLRTSEVISPETIASVDGLNVNAKEWTPFYSFTPSEETYLHNINGKQYEDEHSKCISKIRYSSKENSLTTNDTCRSIAENSVAGTTTLSKNNSIINFCSNQHVGYVNSSSIIVNETAQSLASSSFSLNLSELHDQPHNCISVYQHPRTYDDNKIDNRSHFKEVQNSKGWFL